MKKRRFGKYVDRTIGSDGLVLQTDIRFFTMENGEPTFIKVYMQDIDRLNKYLYRTGAVLFQMLKMMDYNNRIVIASGVKIEICEKLGILKLDGKPAPNVFDQHTKKLVDDGFLFRVKTGIYIANPTLFAKGKWLDVKKLSEQVSTDVKGKEKLDSNI